MARDLIPPPSPAGRPQPGGTPRLVELPPDPPPVVEAPGAAGPLPPSRFRNRFGFMMGALGGVLLAASLILALVLSTGSGDAVDERLEPNWSKWQPSDTSVDGGAAQIAEKVGAEYKHPNGQQLVHVTGGSLPESYELVLRPGSGPIRVLEGPTVVYDLDGLGPNKSIKGGKQSKDRLTVIHREALELALYTFRYLPDVKGVITMLPPPPEEPAAAVAPSAVPTPAPTADPSRQPTALFYRPGDLLPQLQVPLGQTVPADTPNPETLDPAEKRTIDALTLSNKFFWDVQPTGADSAQLVLDRPA